ncbi:MAG TPA: hypothetical protein VGN34_06030 [Ktedonobacteraceae bacterium]
MSLLPVATAARILGLHPKTLHHWLTQAHAGLVPHPTDARIKCVTAEQLLAVARAHGRPLPDLSALPLLERGPASRSHEEQTEPIPTREADPATALPPSFTEAQRLQHLSCLETRVATLQDQLTQLALALLQQRDHPLEQRLTVLETTLQALLGRRACPPHLPNLQATTAENEPPERFHQQPAVHPAEQRRQTRPPLIEYGTGGTYLVLCPEEGERLLLPDSPEWFAWLASLSSFRFVGKSGRLSASRNIDHGPRRTWYAYRSFHQHTYKHYLGTTDHLTIDCLEHMAARLQSHIEAL